MATVWYIADFSDNLEEAESQQQRTIVAQCGDRTNSPSAPRKEATQRMVEKDQSSLYWSVFLLIVAYFQLKKLKYSIIFVFLQAKLKTNLLWVFLTKS